MIQSRWTKKKKKKKAQNQNDLTGFNSHERNLEPRGIFPVWFIWLVLSRRHFSWGSHPLRNRNCSFWIFFQVKNRRFWILLRELESQNLSQIGRVTWGDFEVRHGRWEGGSGGEGTYVCIWLTHVDVRQKPAQYYKASILQLKINELVKNKTQLLYLLAPWLLFYLTWVSDPACVRGGVLQCG